MSNKVTLYAGLKPEYPRDTQQEADGFQAIGGLFGLDLTKSREELLAEAEKAGFSTIRVVSYTLEVEDELTELRAPEGETVN